MVFIREDGEISGVLTDNIASTTVEQASEYAQQVLNSGKTSGYLKNFRYLVTESETTGPMIIFLDRQVQLRSLETMMQLSFTIGVIAMALLAALVIFTVIARYCFSLSWKQLAEFNTTLFAFTTFWGMGINVIKDEHVMIDILYDGVKPARKRWLAIINYLIVLAVVLVFTYQGFKYVGVAGKQISQGMEIPMMYMYGIMPVCGIICAICVVIKIITLYKADISYFAPKNQALSRDDA